MGYGKGKSGKGGSSKAMGASTGSVGPITCSPFKGNMVAKSMSGKK